jgi:sugar phosphate isomerase/epimerase
MSMEDRPGMSRRSFLSVAGSLPLAYAAAARLQAAAGRRIPIAVQLYSVRADCQQDFDAALAQVAAMGFEGVEFAGYYGYAGKAAELRKRLDALHLKVAGTHTALPTLEGDKLKETIDFHQAIGCPFLVVPSNPAFTDPEKSKGLAETFNKVAEALKPLKMACGYHNHTPEFKKDGDKTFWDLFAERTSKDVILQQDCGWTLAAGYDPIEYIKKYPGRTRTTHFKPTVRQGEEGKKPILGQDSVNWAGVYAACQAVGGTEWVVVEQELYPDNRPAMDCTRESLAGLKKIIA